MVNTRTRMDEAEQRHEALSSNGDRTPRAPAVAPPRRRVRIPELAVGVLVMVAFALGAVLWHLSATAKVPALAAASAIERGQVITADDLRVVYVSGDSALVRLDSSESAQVVGRVALVDLAAGTLITPSLVAQGATLGEDDGVVGLALEPGQYPGLDLAPGDRVNVVRSGDAAGGDVTIAGGATVVAVEDLASDRKLVSVLASQPDAEAVAAAAGSGELRLVQVAQ